MSLGIQRRNLSLTDQQGSVILPGDEFDLPTDLSKKLIIGPGLRCVIDKEKNEPSKIVACKAGILRRMKPATYFLETKTCNYQSFKKDDIVGVIKQKSKGEHYALDIGHREYRPQLSKTAFEGATKRYRPDLQIGDCVYGKVMDFPKDFPLEITCVQPSGKSEGLGALQGGHVFTVPIHFVSALRTGVVEDNLLNKIGKIVPCETSVGANGLVWVKAQNAVMTILVSQLIQTLSKIDADEYEMHLKQFKNAVNGAGLTS